MSENHRLEIFSKWERQFRAGAQGGSFWEDFISTITCGPKNGTYDKDSVMRLIADFRTRGPHRLPMMIKSVFICLFILPLAITAQTGSGIAERIMMYWCFPVVAVSAICYLCFQLVPNFMSRQGWEAYGMKEGFLKEDFDSMELRRLARLKSGFLALVPEATYVGDQIWSCKGGIVPLVLRPNGDDYEMVGECYSVAKWPKSDDRKIRLI